MNKSKNTKPKGTKGKHPEPKEEFEWEVLRNPFPDGMTNAEALQMLKALKD